MEARFSQVRVVLIGLSVMLGEIVGGLLATRASIVVAGEWADADPPVTDVLSCRPDVVIGVSGGGWERGLATLLMVSPRLRALALSGEGREAALCTLTPQVHRLGELSAQTLLEAILEQPDWTMPIPLVS